MDCYKNNITKNQKIHNLICMKEFERNDFTLSLLKQFYSLFVFEFYE